MDIAALILWAFTAGVGVYLLWAVNTAKRALAAPPPDVRIIRTPRQPANATAGTATARAAKTTVRGAETVTVPHITHTRVTAGPDDHALLEFSHPALGLVGFGSWFAFTFIHYRGFAWFAFGALVVAIGAGLAWLTSNARAARRRHPGGDGQDTDNGRPHLPRHLIVLHGAAAATTLTLAVITVFAVAHV